MLSEEEDLKLYMDDLEKDLRSEYAKETEHQSAESKREILESIIANIENSRIEKFSTKYMRKGISKEFYIKLCYNLGVKLATFRSEISKKINNEIYEPEWLETENLFKARDGKSIKRIEKSVLENVPERKESKIEMYRVSMRKRYDAEFREFKQDKTEEEILKGIDQFFDNFKSRYLKYLSNSIGIADATNFYLYYAKCATALGEVITEEKEKCKSMYASKVMDKQNEELFDVVNKNYQRQNYRENNSKGMSEHEEFEL